MASKILLSLGAGGSVGASSVKLLKSNEDRVVSVARTINQEVEARANG
jgi:1-deoxy-D-xylulose 5-phosphate reductoisomerase